MTKYTFTCDTDHEPMEFEVEATTDEEAVQKLATELLPHASETHPDMADMNEAERTAFIMSKWTKSEI